MNKVLGFDGIRGLAVIAVVLTHLHFYNILEGIHLMNPAIKSLVSGTAGVQAFFILSGFLITMLLIKEHRKTGAISIKDFFIRRALRIFPLYILFLVISTILFAIDQKVTNLKSLVFSYLYIYNFIPKESYTPFLGHTWSLAVEEHFYLLWPFVFISLVSWKLGSRLIVLFLAVLAAQVLYFLLLKSHYSDLYFIERWSFVGGYNILLGCLISILVHSKEAGEKVISLLNRRLLFIGLLIYLSSSLLFTDYPSSKLVIASLLRAMGLCIFVLYVYANQKSRIVKLLENKSLRYLGLISYGIYMYQGLFLATGPERTPGVFWPPSQSVGIFCVLLIAPLSYHFFEKPFISLKSKFART